MMRNYELQFNNNYKCKRCGKIIKEFGWFSHNRWHKKRFNKTQTKVEDYKKK